MFERLALCVLLLVGCTSTPPSSPKAGPGADEPAIRQLLDDWHAAASRADGEGYFGVMEGEAVFLGTDPGERWTRAAFEGYCRPYFSKGVGWTYEPRERHVQVQGEVAWFDELLWNDKYGDCRGTGVLRKSGGTGGSPTTA